MTTPELSLRRADTVEAAAIAAVKDAQEVLAEYIVPDSGISDFDCVNRLLGILDHRDLVVAMRGDIARADTAAEVVPLAWIGRNGDDEPYVTWRREVADAWNAEPLAPVYSQATIEALSSQVEGLKAERDEAEADLMLAQVEIKFIDKEAFRWKARAEKAEASLASQATPEGFVLAPKEPTEAMFRGLTASWPQDDVSKKLTVKWAVGSFNEDYRAMLAAIPATPEVNK